MWVTISGAEEQQKKHPNYYKEILEGKLDQEVVDSIKTDVPRTFPDNIYFKDYKEGNLETLHNVLVAFAHHNVKIGYCQVSNLCTKSLQKTNAVLKLHCNCCGVIS